MTKTPDLSKWLATALQGLAYWTGHRRCLYRHYPLAEAAFVAELCNLIYANLPDNYSLHCEERFSEFIHRDDRLAFLTERARADLVIYEKRKTRSGGVKRHAKCIIEVKRAIAPKAQIDADLKRLMAVRTDYPDITTYLVVVSEAHRPPRFVSDRGKSITKRQRLDGVAVYFKVRRTLKAAHSYTKIGRSQYACLVEAFADA